MSQKLPFFSSKIPTFDRPVQLTNCLQSLAGLDYPHLGFEVIVVDDGGETLTETVVSSFYDRLNVTFITIIANPDQAGFFTSNNLTVPKSRFRQLGGFDMLFPRAGAEDREFCERWLRHGFRMTYAPEVLIYHAHRLTLHSFCGQQFNYGRGAFRFHKLRARHRSHHLKIERSSFYVNILRYPFSEIRDTKKLLFLALIVLSQGANATGFSWEMVRQIIGKNNQILSSGRYD